MSFDFRGNINIFGHVHTELQSLQYGMLGQFFLKYLNFNRGANWNFLCVSRQADELFEFLSHQAPS